MPWVGIVPGAIPSACLGIRFNPEFTDSQWCVPVLVYNGNAVTTSQLGIGTLIEHVSLCNSLYISFLYNKLTQETCISLSLSWKLINT